MVNESALELPGKYFFFMGYKSIDALVFQLTNHTGAQVNYLLVFIGELLVLDTLQNVLLRGLIEEVEEQPRHGLKCQDFQLMGIAVNLVQPQRVILKGCSLEVHEYFIFWYRGCHQLSVATENVATVGLYAD